MIIVNNYLFVSSNHFQLHLIFYNKMSLESYDDIIVTRTFSPFITFLFIFFFFFLHLQALLIHCLEMPTVFKVSKIQNDRIYFILFYTILFYSILFQKKKYIQKIWRKLGNY